MISLRTRTRIRRNRLRILHCLLSISLLTTLIILFLYLPEKQWIYPYVILVSLLIDLILVLIRFYFVYRRRLVTTVIYNEVISEPERLISNENSSPFIVSIEMDNYEYNKDKEIKNFETSYSSHKCCSICLDDFKDGELISKLKCGHEYHEKCIGIWVYTKPQCPLCKKMLTTDIQEII
jgi:hypothetical protein|tara:strand:- start:514 stop:1050 length:537 start_codon:yes stop_codon:yes gene_type:complete